MNLFEHLLHFHHRKRFISHVVFWIIVLALSISSSSYHNHDEVSFINNFVGDGLNLLAQIMAAYFLAYFIVPAFYRKQYVQAFVFFVAGSYLICLFSRWTIIHLEEPFYGRRANPDETFPEIFIDVPKLLFVYFFRIFSVAFIFVFIKLLKDQQEIQKRAITLEKEKAETELKMLKTQMNPHFLFNTLNNIYSLSLSNSPVTSDAIGRLADILDYILYRCNTTYVPLAGEISLLENYIELEKIRYDDRLKIHFARDIQKDMTIAPLLLLSIVENAFKHGAGNDLNEPVININVATKNNNFRFTVSNSYSPKQEKNASGHIGLTNLEKQLELIYPGEHRLQVTKTENIYTVELQIDQNS